MRLLLVISFWKRCKDLPRIVKFEDVLKIVLMIELDESDLSQLVEVPSFVTGIRYQMVDRHGDQSKKRVFEHNIQISSQGSGW